MTVHFDTSAEGKDVSCCLPQFPIGYTVIGCMEEMQTQISGGGGHF